MSMTEEQGNGVAMVTSSQIFSPTQNKIVNVPVNSRVIRTIVVDDDPALAETMSCILDRFPWIEIVAMAGNGLEAIKAATVEKPDLIVMDINMPVMNGLRATIGLKQRLPETKVLMVSADDTSELALAAMDCGADGFIPKEKIAERSAWHLEQLFGERMPPLGSPARVGTQVVEP